MVKKSVNRNMIVVGGLTFLAVLVGIVVYLNTRLVKEGLANESAPPTVPVPGPVPNDCPTGQQKIDGQCVNTSSMLKASAKVLLQYLGEQGDGK
jgi:hypothetical protein